MNGVTYDLVVRLDQWEGNHERELTAFVFGVYDEYGPEVDHDRPHKEEMAWAGHEDMEGTLSQTAHEEYGLVWSRVEHDHGNGVQWTFEEEPTTEQWMTLVKVFNEYPDANVIGMKLYRTTVKTEEIRAL